jgi:hypothetical protein
MDEFPLCNVHFLCWSVYMELFSRSKPMMAEPELLGLEQFDELILEVQDADAAVRASELAISEYLSIHPNAHAVHVNQNRFIFRLDAITADLELTRLEQVRDEAKERFWRLLRKYADLREKLNPPEVHIHGIK